MALFEGRGACKDVSFRLFALVELEGVGDVAFDVELEITTDASGRVVEDAVDVVGDDGVDVEEHDAVELGPGGYAEFCHDFGVALFGIDPVCSQTFDLDNVGTVLDEAIALGLRHVSGHGDDKGYTLLGSGFGVMEELVGEDAGTDEVDITVVGLGVVDCRRGEKGYVCVF